MHTIKTTTGAEVVLDGDLLAIIETLFQEVAVRRGLKHSYEDMMREVQYLVDQIIKDDRRAYLVESLFYNTVRYENDRLVTYMKKLSHE